LKQAVSGLDEALSTAAEASKLAMKEAVGRGEDFSEHDLKRSLNDIQGLQDLFVETLRDAASSSKEQLSITLNDLADHAQHSGSAVGEQIETTLKEFAHQLESTGQAELKAGAESLKTTGSLLARLAAGMLEGVSDSLHTQNSTATKTDKKED
jgi:ElaB/YqjD/DUF883 family membrane-anchored ribosome-binding protein